MSDRTLVSHVLTRLGDMGYPLDTAAAALHLAITNGHIEFDVKTGTVATTDANNLLRHFAS